MLTGLRLLILTVVFLTAAATADAASFLVLPVVH